jgi:hypothetical protein
MTRLILSKANEKSSMAWEIDQRQPRPMMIDMPIVKDLEREFDTIDKTARKQMTSVVCNTTVTD